ncbi:hypothetical protein ABIE56_000108 [Luteibacter sp. 621]
MQREPHIHCPLCGWEPKADSRWICAPDEPGAGCMTRWNVFWTGGCCPGCGHLWRMTACYECNKATPLRDWYHYPSDAERVMALAREVEASLP